MSLDASEAESDLAPEMKIKLAALIITKKKKKTALSMGTGMLLKYYQESTRVLVNSDIRYIPCILIHTSSIYELRHLISIG